MLVFHGHLAQVFHQFINLLASHSASYEGVGIGFVVVGSSDAVEEFFVRKILHKGRFQVCGTKVLAGIGRGAINPMAAGALILIDSLGLSQAVRREE